MRQRRSRSTETTDSSEAPDAGVASVGAGVTGVTEHILSVSEDDAPVELDSAILPEGVSVRVYSDEVIFTVRVPTANPMTTRFKDKALDGVQKISIAAMREVRQAAISAAGK